jgi:methyl-accepting chemotaxis protein
MKWFNNLKFVRKIQGGYTLLGSIATLAVLLSFIGILRIKNVQESVFSDYVFPKNQIDYIYSDFRQIQFIMLQCSMPSFASKFQTNVSEYNKLKGEIDKSIDSLINSTTNPKIKENLQTVKQNWSDYKMMVADAILSASVTGQYDMAADIATSSGEEMGQKMLASFNNITDELSATSEALDKDSHSVVSLSIWLVVISALLGTAIYLLSAFYMAPAITKPLNKIKNHVQEFAKGDFSGRLDYLFNDEIGELSESLNELGNAQLEKVNIANQIAEGKIVKVEPASDKDSLALAFNKVVDTIESILSEAEKIIDANKNGNMDYRAEFSNYKGAWRQLLEGMNSIIEVISQPLNESASVINMMAHGDFTQRITGNYKGYYDSLKSNINTLADSLNNALSEVAINTETVLQTTKEISSSSEQMAAGAQEQTQQASEVAHSVEEMTKTIMENSKNASNVAETAKGSGEKAVEGGKAVRNTLEGMFRIAEVVEQSAKKVEELGKNSDQIGEIIQVINDIADQTNLLALNAAIEAARAGEQGRGFAVVADEVRKLAERTTKATKEIANMIKQIQSDTHNAVASMKQGTEEVNKGKQLAERAGKVLEEIILGSEKVTDIAVQVAAASEEQSASAEQISKNVEAISNVTRETTIGIEHMAHAAEDLDRMTSNLQELVRKFKLTGNETSQYSVRQNGKIIHSNF